jgi:flagellar hook-associated protein 2
MILQVSASQAQVTASTNFGTLTFAPGVSARLNAVAASATDTVSGFWTSAEQAVQKRIDGFAKQIDSMEIQLKKREERLRRQFSTLESTIGSLKNQQSWLSGQIAKL